MFGTACASRPTAVAPSAFRFCSTSAAMWVGSSMSWWRVTAPFPELPAAHAVQEARGEGSSLSVGIKRALDAILGEPHVKGRRISTVKLYVRVQTSEKERS
jgi:hypothetical protein